MKAVDVPIPAQTPAHVRAIMEATQETLGELFECEAVYTEGRVCPAQTLRTDEVSVIVGFNGALRGQILLGMSQRTAMAMASGLLMEEVQTFDDMTRSGMAEIANIVAGGCATALHRQGFVAGISLPTVIAGEGVSVSWPNLFILEATLALPSGPIHMAVGLKVEAQ